MGSLVAATVVLGLVAVALRAINLIRFSQVDYQGRPASDDILSIPMGRLLCVVPG